MKKKHGRHLNYESCYTGDDAQILNMRLLLEANGKVDAYYILRVFVRCCRTEFEWNKVIECGRTESDPGNEMAWLLVESAAQFEVVQLL